LLSSKIEKRSSSISGIGLFAKQTIEKGETVWHPTAELMEKIHIGELHPLPESEKYDWIKHSYQIGETLYKDIDDTRFMNHSCSPNVIDFLDILVAARKIHKDEEITWDYLPYMNPYLVFDCRCGNQNCVRVVKKGTMISVKA
jgi:SET domain-containing protein